MKDSYSFDLDEDSAKKSYYKMFVAYLKTFQRMSLKVIPVSADSGPIGGSLSHEFSVIAPTGESEIFCDKNLLDLDINKKSYSNDDEITQTVEDYLSFYSATDEKYNESDFNKNVEKSNQISGRGIEVGHIFSFGDKYSKPMKASVVNIDGKNSNVYMGSYGIGVSRLVATIIECFNDDNGIIWPISVAPFKVNIINLKNNDEECLKKCMEIHDLLENHGIETIFDNRDESAGRKFSDADLIGIPFQLIVGPRELKNGNVELKNRKTDAKEILSFDSAINKIKNKIFEE